MFRFERLIKRQHGRAGEHKYAAGDESQGEARAIIVDKCKAPCVGSQERKPMSAQRARAGT